MALCLLGVWCLVASLRDLCWGHYYHLCYNDLPLNVDYQIYLQLFADDNKLYAKIPDLNDYHCFS